MTELKRVREKWREERKRASVTFCDNVFCQNNAHQRSGLTKLCKQKNLRMNFLKFPAHHLAFVKVYYYNIVYSLSLSNNVSTLNQEREFLVAQNVENSCILRLKVLCMLCKTKFKADDCRLKLALTGNSKSKSWENFFCQFN